MTDFKVGDKVEVVTIYGNTYDRRVGAKGTITEVRARGMAYNVCVEDKGHIKHGATLVIYHNELKLVEPETKFQVGDVVTFCMPDFAGWQGGEGIVRALPTEQRNFYKVELVVVPPANKAQRVGNKVDLLEGWIKLVETHVVKNAKGEAVEHPAPLKIYLAGPMSGIEHYNFPAFFTAARKLRKAGHTVFNPAENDLATGFNALGMEGHEAAAHGFSLRDALKTDLSWICENADALVLLDGWEGSKGVRAEMALAEALGLPKYEMAKLPVEVAK